MSSAGSSLLLQWECSRAVSAGQRFPHGIMSLEAQMDVGSQTSEWDHRGKSVGSRSVQGPCRSKRVYRAVLCSPLYSRKQAKTYLKITIIFSQMGVPTVYKVRKGKTF